LIQYSTDSDSRLTEPFPILDLPRELRDRILFHICGDQIREIVLDKEDNTKLRSMPAPGPPIIRGITDSAKINTMNILLLSRQLAVEAARVVYTTSLFCFHKPGTFRSFVATTPTEHLSLISKVYMSFHVRNPKDRSVWEDLLTKTDSLSQLKTLKKLYLKLTVRPLRLTTTVDELKKQEILRSSKALRMLKLATLVVEIQSIVPCDPSEHVSRHMKEMRDFVEGQSL
jgi:hypothetical protein